ncbi:MAG: helix-turn-helix domain-containing protein, partial [Pseudanabaenaceae cyanobacterium]
MTTQGELAAKLAEIGAQLKQVREAKDLTLDQIQAATLISKRHLQALEEGNLDHLPELVYVQGFIRKYGQAVGIVNIADQFPPAVPPLEGLPSSPKPELRPWHLYVLYVAIVFTSVSVLALFLQEPLPRREKVSPPVTEPQVVPQVVTPPTSPTSAGAPVNVKVEMHGESWLR